MQIGPFVDLLEDRDEFRKALVAESEKSLGSLKRADSMDSARTRKSAKVTSRASGSTGRVAVSLFGS